MARRGAAVALVAWLPLAHGADVARWDVFETSYRSAQGYTNAFVEVEVDVVFEQGNRQWKVPAFWSGGDNWTVRFAPPLLGTYKFRVECSDKTNPDLNGQERTLSVGSYKGDNPLLKHGFVKVSPGDRYFKP